MKYLLWVLGLFAAAVALTIASHNSGYVLLVLPPYRVELSLTLFISLLLLTFVLGYVLIRLSIGILQLPEYVRKFRSDRAQAKARKLLEEELFAFFEGRYADSENAANQAMELGDPQHCMPSSPPALPMSCANSRSVMPICMLPKAGQVVIPPCA